MLLKKLKDFHERTMEQYKEEENLEPWKKKVMELHESLRFYSITTATLEEMQNKTVLSYKAPLLRVNFPLEVLCIFIPARENILEAVVS